MPLSSRLKRDCVVAEAATSDTFVFSCVMAHQGTYTTEAAGPRRQESLRSWQLTRPGSAPSRKPNTRPKTPRRELGISQASESPLSGLPKNLRTGEGLGV